jgi:nicotinate-nucleotide adenylyltransferase
MKIGLFFGSFNPIHIGHLIIANIMKEQTDLEQVWFVVSPQNPLKKNKGLLHEFDRYDMVQRAIADNYNFKVCDVEFHMPKPSYTIDTMTWLQEKHPEHSFVLIIGEDNLVQFEQWKNHDKILQYFQLYVYPRHCLEESELKNNVKVRMVPAPLLDISATFIRDCVKNNKSIRYMVTPEVENFIQQKNFYLS